ncbi:MAG TPA: hypothetical protein VFR23_24845 [Jiangellaceae bacterium]|nr:hypothetical protein [Jiangellaceae bacterium]
MDFDDIVKANPERRRREFLERCAVAWCSDSIMSDIVVAGEANANWGLKASGLVGTWSALWDAIEADERRRREQ